MPPRKPPPKSRTGSTGSRSTGSAQTRSGPTRVGSYTRADGTSVRSHSRENQWRQAAGAWVGAGASGALSLALVADLGFTIISGLAMLLTALIAAGALMATERVTRKQRTMRRKVARNKGRGRASSARGRSQRRR